MERIKHNNDIEIKLLANRRFLYANRKSNIVITAEHSATDVTVLFPDEYEEYSKRVDFVNSQGKEWTEGLYIPEYKKYKGGFHKTRFRFTLPSEVTTEGELKMQFLAYLPDESMTTVPFEVIPIDVVNGVLAFKRNARANPDLLILSANKSEQALFNSQKAVAKSEKADEQSLAAIEIGNQNAADIAAESGERKQADAELRADLDAETERATLAEESLAVALAVEINRATEAETAIVSDLAAEIERSMQKDADLTAALEAETEARIAGDAANAEAIQAENERAVAAESGIATELAAEIERAKAAEETNARAISDETERARAAEETIAADLATETVRATQAENAIATGLAAEVQRSAQADAEHSQAIEDNALAIAEETIRAVGAESAISAALAAEVSRASTAEQINAAAIQAETERAVTAETALGERVDAERTRAMAAESNLQSELTSESSRSIQADAELRADLNTEIARAQTAEQINAAAIAAETIRATQAEVALGYRITTEVPAALTEAKAYADQVAEQVRIDGTIYKGTLDESELPSAGNENGDLYWISDFNFTQPGHSGSAIWNGKTNKWDFNIDRYKHQDDETIVARDSDGALKVADTNETNLTADTADFTSVVNLGNQALNRTVIRKVRGLHQKTDNNAAVITAETSRAQTAESGLSSRINAEETRAKAAEQINANAIAAETLRATTAEGALSEALAAETARAQTAEQTNANAIVAETARAQTAESGLSARIDAEETRAKAAEQANANAIAAEKTRAMSAESGLSSALAAEETARIAGDSANAAAIAAETTRAQTAEAGKVDKIAGKGLSTEDYTTAEKNKLAGIAAGANNYTHPTTHPTSIIAQDVNNRFVSDGEKAAWSGKAEKTPATPMADGLMSAADKAKLNGVADNANNYAHPTSHSPSMIAQDANNRFMTDAERAKLAGIAAGAQVNEVNDAPNDGKQYARKNKAWAEVVGGGGTGSDTKAATVTIGFTADCDIVLSGTANHETAINNAINALSASGGKILLREGVYSINASVIVNKLGVTLEGMGSSTELRKVQSTNAIVLPQTNCIIQSLRVNSNGYGGLAVFLENGSGKNSILNNRFEDAGIWVGVSQNNHIEGNIINTDSSRGIEINGSFNIIKGNVITTNSNLPIGFTSQTIASNTIIGNILTRVTGTPAINCGANNMIISNRITTASASNAGIQLGGSNCTGNLIALNKMNGVIEKAGTNNVYIGNTTASGTVDSEGGGSGVDEPEVLMRWRGTWSSSIVYKKMDVVQRSGTGTNYLCLSLTDGNLNNALPTGDTATAHWVNLAGSAFYASRLNVGQNASKMWLVGATNMNNSAVGIKTQVYMETDGTLYDSRGRLAAEDDIPQSEGGGGLDCVNIQMEYYSETLGLPFYLQAECLMPSLENILGEGIWDEIADNGYLIPDSELESMAIMAFIIAASGGKASIAFAVDEFLTYTTPVTCLCGLGKYGPDIMGLTARVEGEDMDLIEVLGESELTGIYILPNSGNATLGILLAMIGGEGL